MASPNNEVVQADGKMDGSSTELTPAHGSMNGSNIQFIQAGRQPSTTIRVINSKNVNISSRECIPGTIAQGTLKLCMVEAEKLFIETETFRQVQRKLVQFGHVTICGASGEGKTFMALMLARDYMKKGYEIAFVENVDVFHFNESISSTHKLVLIIDDIFGTVGLTTDASRLKNMLISLSYHIKDCRDMSGNTFSSKQNRKGLHKSFGGQAEEERPEGNKNIHVVFTSKTYNFQEGISKLKYQRLRMFKGQTVVDLTKNKDYCYSCEEKIKIFKRQRNFHCADKTEEISEKVIRSLDSALFGFPLTCRLFFEFAHFRGNAKDFFGRPLFYLKIEISNILNLGNNQSAALILMLLSEGKLDLNELELEGNDQIFKHVTDFVPSATRSGTATAARSFRGTFFSRGDTIRFAHPSVYDACAFIMFEINPSFILKYCSYDFLYERLKPLPVDETRSTDHLHFLFVSDNYYDLVAKRLANAIKSGHFAKTVTHPILKNDKFCRLLLHKLQVESCSVGLSDTHWIHQKDRGRGFLCWAVQGYNNLLVNEIESEVKIRFTKNEITEALQGCLETNNLTLLKTLFSRLGNGSHVTETRNRLLLLSAEHADWKMAEYLLSQGADIKTSNTNKCNYIHLVCKSGKSDILKALMKQGRVDTHTALLTELNCVDVNGRTPAMTAAVNASWGCFQLLKDESDKDLQDAYGNSVIHLASWGGCKDIVQHVVTPSNINSRGQHGWTPVMVAAVHGQQSVFDLLISNNADLTLMDVDGDSLLHLACEGGNTDIVQHVLTPSNINSRGRHGWTPVMVAAVHGQQSVFDLLISNNADLTLMDVDGDSLLHLACHGGNTDIVQHVLTPSNINSRGQHGWTPVMVAVVTGQQSVFDLLISNNADLTLMDVDGDSLLHLACEGGNTDIVQHVLSPSNINSRGKHGWTPVMKAAVHGQQSVFDLLISNNADLKLMDVDGDSLLHLACQGGNTDIVQHVLTPSNINSRIRHGWTPVMVAAVTGQQSVFDLLISNNADLTLMDVDGDSLLHLACGGGNTDIVQHVLTPSNINSSGKHGWTPVMVAAVTGQQSVFDLLISNNADLTLMDVDGDSLLHLACGGGNTDIVQHVLTPSNINSRGKHGWTPVMKAAVHRKQSVFDLLISNNADLKLMDVDGDSLLHLACQGGNTDIVQHVLTPSNINSRIRHGWTPVMVAAVTGQQSVFDLLISNNADLTLMDVDGDSLLHLACGGDNTDIVQHVLTPSNINSSGKHGWTPVMVAAVTGQQSVFDLLISNNADLTLMDVDGDSVLHLACGGGNTDIVQHVLTPSNINSRGQHGWTPVMKAAVHRKQSVFDLLISNNADLTLMDVDGDSLLHLACEGGNTDIVQHVLTPSNINSRGQHGWTPVMKAAVHGQQSVFDLLISNNADLTLMDVDGDSLLHLACEGGNTDIVQHVLTPSNINSRGQHGWTPVMKAAVHGQQSVFDLLISNNADLTLMDVDGDSLLHLACEGGNTDIMQHVLTPSNINSRGRHGWTPVMKAAVTGQQSMFDLLISNNADLTLMDVDGDSLLHLACGGGNTDIVQHVLTPSNINSRGKHGWTSVMKAAVHEQQSVFDLLISNNADLTLMDVDGDSLLHLACGGGNTDIVQHVLTPSNINSRGQHGWTPVMKAAVTGQQSVFDLLISNNADLTLMDVYGHSLLHLACGGGNTDIVQHVLTPSNINSRGQHGWTPVMVAAVHGQQSVFDLLISNNADLTLMDVDGDSLLHLACGGGNTDIVQHVQTPSNINSRGQHGLTPVMKAAVTGQQSMFDLLISNNADLTLMDVYGNSLLHLACGGGNTDIVQHVLTPSNINSRGQHGLTPVMKAAVHGQQSVFDLLISNNADLTLMDVYGNSLLHLACGGGNTDIVQHVLTPSNINSRGQHGWTPVMKAAVTGQQSMFDLLISNNADRTLMDVYGNSLLHLACGGGNTDIVQHVLTPSNINSRGQHGWTPVMKAAYCGQRNVFDLLVENNADLSLVDKEGHNVVDLAVKGQADLAEYLKLLTL